MIQRLLTVSALFLLTAVANVHGQVPPPVVTNTNDSGQGSLRQAILNANSTTAADTITFQIPGAGPHRIQLLTALPAVTGPTVIDGFSQSGASANTLATGNNAVLKIELTGGGPTNFAGLQMNGANSVVRGLVINGFTFGITFNGVNGSLQGCFVGTNVTGTAAAPNGVGIRVTLFASGTTIGGTSPAARNVISGNSGNGLQISSAMNVSVQGNYIGTNAVGSAAVSNSAGVTVGISDGNPDNALIGGTAAGAGNLISGNRASGVFLSAFGTLVQGNRIGTNALGDAAIPNQDGIGTSQGAGGAIIGGAAAGAGNVISGNNQNGVYLTAAGGGFVIRGNLIGPAADGSSALGNAQHGIQLGLNPQTNTNIGGTAAGEGNVIAFNGRDGVSLSIGTGTRVLGNSIHSNGSTANDLGIDLGPDGITPNDSSDQDIGANNLQNFPAIATATVTSGILQITGSLQSIPNTTYRLEFFSTGQIDAAGPLQGRAFLGSANVTTGANGSATFDVSFQQSAIGGQVTATATDPNGNTSEFGLPLPVITSPRGVRVTIGQPFYYLLKATSDPSSYGMSIPANKGLTYDSFLDAVIGTPTEVGDFLCTMTASNAAGTRTETLTVRVQPVPSSGLTITSSYSSSGRTGRPFEFQVITTGGSGATRVAASNLPPGLAINEVTGIISGTPTQDGSFSVQLTATDGNSSTAETLQLTFISQPEVPVIISPSSVIIAEGQQFSYTIAAPESSPEATVFTLLGNLPAGLGFDSSTGTIAGTYTPQSATLAARGKPLSGGVITNVQLFATNSQGTSTIPLVFFLAPKGLVNIATRLAIGTDKDVLIGGFIVTGNAPKKLIIRAISSSLAVAGALQDPLLELRQGSELIGGNDDWRSAQEQEIINTGIPPSDNRESAIIAILQPGAYTAIVAGKNSTTGIGVVEVYDLGTASLDSTSDSKLANISTRGFVQTGDDVMIGGLIVSGGSTKVIIRAVGPSLANRGVAGALEDTTLEFVNSAGTVITANDDWRAGPQEQQIIDSTVAPEDDREAAVVVTLNPGQYTAVVRGKDGRIGVGSVEAYVLN